jgi:hypothetical protein
MSPQKESARPKRGRRLFRTVSDSFLLAGSLCTRSPLPFGVVLLLALAAAYIFRVLSHAQPPILISVVIVISIYYALLGSYGVFIYNRYLDPLLAIPGPKVRLFRVRLTGGTLVLWSSRRHSRGRSWPHCRIANERRLAYRNAHGHANSKIPQG